MDGRWPTWNRCGERVEKGYRVDNIPVYAPLLAYGDIVTAAIEKGRLESTGIVGRSGHATVRIIAYEAEYVPGIEEELTTLGCAFEHGPIPTFLAVDIPPMKDYRKIIGFLESGFRHGRFDYEEALVWW